MLEQQGEDSFEAKDAEKLVGEVFSGRLTTLEAIQRLRTRLLDLSSRNRLLNYRHPRGRCVQFVENPNLNVLFDRLLIDAKNIVLKPVPEPDPNSYEGRRPDPKQHAQDYGIDVSFEFPPSPTGDINNGKKLKNLQTLLYPAELKKLLKKVAYESKTAIEETGTNMLFLVFGFLEFYDSEDSDRAMLAPLLSLPAVLSEIGVDEATSVVQYALAHSGEDLAENHTLREKLHQDFALTLPEFSEDDEPETYFKKVEKIIKARSRWRVRRQLTLGMLSFGKLALWEDLDPVKNPGLLEHPLLKNIFEGGTSEGGSEFYAEDYEIDKRADADLPIIYDADSSQHSAIIDAIAGKNMVINGPPGTGKSQTITNIIASNLSMGKTVLFVSEKLAALEVVRHRLNHAGLGHFCLELHSHKTQKKKFVEELQARLDETFQTPSQLKAKLPTLQRQKSELARYAEIMGSRVGNALDLTVNEVFWAAERRRQELGDLSANVHAETLTGASKWEQHEIKERRDKVDALAELYRIIGSFDFNHPWWGFRPGQLGPGDSDSIADIIGAALEEARLLESTAETLRNFLEDDRQMDTKALEQAREKLATVPDAPENLASSLLVKMFGSEDPKGERSGKLLTLISSGVLHARSLLSSAEATLDEDGKLSLEDSRQAREVAKSVLTQLFLKSDVQDEARILAEFEGALDRFRGAAAAVKAPYGQIGKTTLAGLSQRMEKTAWLDIFSVPVRDIIAKTKAVESEAKSLSADLAHVEGIAKSRHLPFDGSPSSIVRIADSSSIEGLRSDAVINAETVARGRAIVERFPLSQCPIEDLASRASKTRELADSFLSAWERCQKAAKGIGISFDDNPESIKCLAALAHVAELAPHDLLDYRHSALAHPRVAELADKAEEVINWEETFRGKLDMEFYLDSLPSKEEMKVSMKVFRRGDSLFNIFKSEWRDSKRLFDGIAKSKTKRKAADLAEGISSLVTWIERKEGFQGDNGLSEAFGSLFKGFDTDLVKVRRLHAWYVEIHSSMTRVPGLVGTVDLDRMEISKIAQLASLAGQIKADADLLDRSEALVRESMGADILGFKELKEKSLPQAVSHLVKAVTSVSECVDFFSAKALLSLSPTRAQELMEARLELVGASDALARLARGQESLTIACGEPLASLAPLDIGIWSDELKRVNEACVRAWVLTDNLKDIFEMSVTPSAAKEFIEAKTALDAVWSRCALIPSWDSVSNWDSWIALARSAKDSAGTLLSVVASSAKPGKSADEVFQAIEDRAQGESLLKELRDSSDVSKLLGEMFAGAETNLEALASTQSWGAKVVAAGLPASLRRKILSDSAVESLAQARELFEGVVERHSWVVSALSRVEAFGSFNWDEWQKQSRSDAKKDLPSEIYARMKSASSSINEVLPWAKYLAARQERKSEGLGAFIGLLESKTLPPESLAAAFEFVTYQTIGKSIHQNFPEIVKFNGVSHEKLQREYQALDKEIIRLTGRAFASQIDKSKNPPEGMRTAKVSDKTEMELVRHMITRPRARLSIRHILRKAGVALRELKPCFMMSPLSVATYIPQGSVQFDLLVMDEASQIKPEDALGGFARAKQVIVVGDPKQLPPSSFFDRLTSGGDGDDTEDILITDESESILDVCQDIFHPVRSLRWHYRSQHESLIAFSNHHFYKNLIVFPSPYAKSSRLGVRYRWVRGGVYKDRQNIPEAQRVVDAVLEHMLTRMDESLGVVTLNQTQRELIEELLDKKLRDFDEGREYLSHWVSQGWPFFIKNLENVQGDERDVIFISTTFGKAPGTDKLRQNFGPISRPDGWRRLNVLFTRARRKVELFTSMSPEDVIADEKTPLGTKVLKEYLDFAKRGVLVSTDEGEREPDSDFEVAVANVLRAHGYEVKPQLGVAGFFLDMAVRNPDRRGEFLAGIECDGAAYHSGFSVRDRDRIRQEILESLGWRGRIYRIWSTDWFYDPRRQIEKLLSFLEERRRLSLEEPDHAPDNEPELEEDILIEEGDSEAESAPAIEALSSEIQVHDDAEDLFVEVGDRVVYFFVDMPTEKHSVLIVDSASNPKMGLINEATPLAQALLGSSTGDTTSLSVNGQSPRIIQVVKIQRQESLI